MSTPADTLPIFAPPTRLRRVLPLLGLVLLAFVLSRLDAAATADALLRLNGASFAWASAAFFANLLLKGLRWWRMLQAQGKPLPLPTALSAFFGSQFYGQVTVGRVGEFFRAEALLERGHGFAEALSSCVVDRLFDVFAVCLLGAALGALLAGSASLMTIVVAALVLGGSGLVLTVLALRGALLPRAMALRLSMLLARAQRRFRGLDKGLSALGRLVESAQPLLRTMAIAEAMMWTALSWALYFGALSILANGLGLVVPWLALFGAASLAALSALLPVTVSGLGAREVIYQQVLAGFGVSSEAAVVLSLLHLTVMSLTAIVTGFGGLWVRRRQRRRGVV